MKDMSVLPPASSSSWRTLLKGVATLCSQELFESRVLSRDMLKLSEDLNDLFTLLCDALGGRNHASTMVVEGIPGLTREHTRSQIHEEVVLFQQLPALDCLALDRSVCVTDDARVYLERLADVMEMSGQVVRSTCERAAMLIKDFFASRDFNATYFTVPPTPKWISREFGRGSPINIDLNKGTTDDSFDRVMEIIESSQGPLTPSALQQVKKEIIADPGILRLWNIGGDFDLVTIFHHAVAGEIRDRRLVEWLICMGVLYHEVEHYRNPPEPGELMGSGLNRERLSNTIAVHCAAVNGLKEMVQYVLEAGGMRDLDTVTYRTKDSLAHLAVKHGHQDLFDKLRMYGADFMKPNGEGKHVYQLTSDSEWKKEIVQAVVTQRRQEAKLQKIKGRDTQFQEQVHNNAQRLRREIDQQRELEQSVSSTSTQKATKKKVKSSNSASCGHGRDHSHDHSHDHNHDHSHEHSHDHHQDDALVGAAAAMLESARIDDPSSRPPTTAEDKERLTAAMLKVTESGDAAAAEIALGVLGRVHASINHVASLSMSHPQAKGARERGALFAEQAMYQLYKYHRKLTASSMAHDPQSALYKLQTRASVSEFWVTTASTTAKVLMSCDRRAQGIELFNTIERRLLKLSRRPLHFRKCVQVYTEAHTSVSLSPCSSTDSLRVLAWYLTDAEIQDDEALMRLDQLHWCSVFSGMIMLPTIADSHLCCFRRELEAMQPAFMARNQIVALLDERLVIGGSSKQTVRDAMYRVGQLGRRFGLAPASGSMQSLVPRLALLGFEFSAAGILPVEGIRRYSSTGRALY